MGKIIWFLKNLRDLYRRHYLNISTNPNRIIDTVLFYFEQLKTNKAIWDQPTSMMSIENLRPNSLFSLTSQPQNLFSLNLSPLHHNLRTPIVRFLFTSKQEHNPPVFLRTSNYIQATYPTKRVYIYIHNILHMEQVIQILKDNQAEKFATIEEKNFQLIEKRPGVTDIIERKQKFLEGSISQDVSSEKFQSISEKIDELGIPADISQALPVGGVFRDYGEMDNVFDEGKTVLKHRPGEVLLVDVWATWCGPCQRPMQHNQEMLEKNEAAWGENVRIVAVSVDEDKALIAGRVNSKKWTKIQHLTLLGWNGDHQLIKDFAISGIPFVCLVNKFGKINYLGHPSSINLEETINSLLAEDKENIGGPAAKEEENAAPEEKPVDLSGVLTAANISAKFANSELVSLKVEESTKFDKGKISKKGTVVAHVFAGDKDTIQIINKEFDGSTITVKEVPFVTVPLQENPACWECKAALNYPFYWLKWEEGAHFGCRACVEKKSTKEGHQFNYEKNSVLLTGKWDKIALKGLGSNIQPADITQHQGGHNFGCNGCGSGSGQGQARYICLGCRADPNPKGDYVDLCEPCIQNIAQNKPQVKQNLKGEHHCDNHPFLRVLYSVKGYYEY